VKGLSLRRATLEMFVIVGSILLAFGLDAGWDAHQRQADAEDLLTDLLAEFEETATELERAVVRNQEVITAATEILAQLTRFPGNPEVAASTLAKLILVPTTDPRRGNLDALVASGDFGLVSHRHLRGSLADWPAALRDLQEEELDARVFVQTTLIPFLANAVELQPIFAWRLAATPSSRGVTDIDGTELSDDPMIRLPSDRQFSNLVATRRYLSQFTVSNAGTVQEELEAIVRALREAVTN
jgi:hypothetical protein